MDNWAEVENGGKVGGDRETMSEVSPDRSELEDSPERSLLWGVRLCCCCVDGPKDNRILRADDSRTTLAVPSYIFVGVFDVIQATFT